MKKLFALMLLGLFVASVGFGCKPADDNGTESENGDNGDDDNGDDDDDG